MAEKTTAPTNLARLNAAEVVVKTLIANGIKELYCLPGVQNDDFFDALARVGTAIRPIHTRHEQATAYMALGAALATRRRSRPPSRSPSRCCASPATSSSASSARATATCTRSRISSGS